MLPQARTMLLETLRNRHYFLPKDFIEAGNGVLCAVVAEGHEEQRVLVTPRYVRNGDGGLRKLSTDQSNQLVRQDYASWLYYSRIRDIELPAIPIEEITCVYRPSEQWPSLLSTEKLANRPSTTPFQSLADILAPILSELGVTGSHLVGGARPGSDIDLVAYGLPAFSQAQRMLSAAARAGTSSGSHLTELSESQWRDCFERRGCDELTFAEYVWHEQRKQNKFSVDGIKVDLSCVDEPHPTARAAGRKLGRAQVSGRVVDATYAFSSPAVFKLDHPTIKTIVVYTATYVGQAQRDDWIEACGVLEEELTGGLRLLVGSSREAIGEYIKVR